MCVKKAIQLLVIILAIITIINLSGCSNKAITEYTPEQVVSNALAEEGKYIEYYGESIMTIEDNKEEKQTISLKEWRNEDKQKVIGEEDKYRFEVLLTEDSMLFYDSLENEVMDLNSLSGNLPQTSPQEQASEFLKSLEETHDIKMIGEEKIVNRATYHLKATAKNDANLFGDADLYIDKEKWLVLKMKVISGDSTVDVEYTKIDFKSKLADSIFKLDLPDDVSVEDVSEASGKMVEKTLSIAEIGEGLSEPFLFFKEDEYKIKEIKSTKSKDKHTLDSVEISYTDGEYPMFTLSIIKSDDNESGKERSEDSIKIRGHTGHLFEFNQSKIIMWEEDNILYSIDILNPNINVEEILALTKNMELTN